MNVDLAAFDQLHMRLITTQMTYPDHLVWDACEALARAMFYAELGATGMTWEKLDDLGRDEWLRKAGRALESWWQTDKPFVLLNLRDGEISWHPPDQVFAT